MPDFDSVAWWAVFVAAASPCAIRERPLAWTQRPRQRRRLRRVRSGVASCESRTRARVRHHRCFVGLTSPSVAAAVVVTELPPCHRARFRGPRQGEEEAALSSGLCEILMVIRSWRSQGANDRKMISRPKYQHRRGAFMMPWRPNETSASRNAGVWGGEGAKRATKN